MTVDHADVVARYPELEPLLAVGDPPWRLYAHGLGAVHGERATDWYVEVFYLIDLETVCVIRRTSSRWRGLAVQPVEFTGILEEAVARLLSPPKPEGAP
jgi:hypothetical protein